MRIRITQLQCDAVVVFEGEVGRERGPLIALLVIVQSLSASREQFALMHDIFSIS